MIFSTNLCGNIFNHFKIQLGYVICLLTLILTVPSNLGESFGLKILSRSLLASFLWSLFRSYLLHLLFRNSDVPCADFYYSPSNSSNFFTHFSYFYISQLCPSRKQIKLFLLQYSLELLQCTCLSLLLKWCVKFLQVTTSVLIVSFYTAHPSFTRDLSSYYCFIVCIFIAVIFFLNFNKNIVFTRCVHFS